MHDYELCPGMYKRQYRAKPKEETIKGMDMVKVLAMVVGIVVAFWWAAVYG